MNWKNKRVLITGAGGFVGSHLAEQMVRLNTRVRCFIRYNSRNDWGQLEILPPDVKDKLEIVMGDLKDGDAVQKAVRHCEVVFHLGALIAIPYSYVHPLDFVQTNVVGTVNLLNACRENLVTKIVHTSTSEVYGTAQYAPIDERHPLQGQSPYSASKIGADKMAESYHRAFSLPVATIRPFNTYGPRQSARAIIPTIITQILAGRTVSLGSLTPTRDFTYVTDLVQAFIKIAESDQTTGQVVNIGSGREISIGDLVQKISELTGRKAKVVADARRVRPARSEVERLLADTRRAQKLIKWKPAIPLEEGLSRTIDWIKENINRYKVNRYNI